jgi:hypothetical protein
MKNTIIIIGLLAGCLVQFSCNKDFLDKTDPTKIGTKDFYKNQTEALQALNGVYGQLQGIINSQWLFNELPSDNTTIDYNPSDRGQADKIEAFEFWQVNAGSPNLDGMYNGYYNALYNINNTLAKIQTGAIPDSAKSQIAGQLKFLRGYYYFELVQYFGEVILITKPLEETAQAWDYVRKPADTVYAQITADLKAAAAVLPVKYDAADVGRVTKGAALTLLGKVYLTEKQYGQAVSTLQQVLPLGYSLCTSYADNFDPAKKNGPESIFEVQYQGGNDLGEWSSFIYTFAPRLSKGAITGWPQSNPGGWNIPTKDLIASYEPGDLRKAASIGLDFKSPVTGDTVPYIKKYDHIHTIYGRTDDDWPVLRYSDVLLMLSEAINEQTGPTTEAYRYINQVRQRAGLKPLAGLDQETFRKAVLHERRVEFAFENWRWFDLKRTETPDMLAQYLNDYGAKEKANPTVTRQGIPYSKGDYDFTANEALYPIPSEEILVNDKLTQNPGY